MSTRPDDVLPRLLALDVGGVLVETGPAVDWAPAFARELIADARRAAGPGPELPAVDQVAADLLDGRTAHTVWKDRTSDGAELGRLELWAMLSRPGWGPALLDHVAGNRERLTAQLCLAWETRELRPAIDRLLDYCQQAGIAVCVVSNTISGRAYRTVLERAGLGGRFAGLSFSDEVGFRKPDPRLLQHGIAAANATPEQTWYVGDTYRRDVVCGRRARVASTILMRSRRTEPEPGEAPAPDVVVDDPEQLLGLVTSTVPTPR